MKTYRIRDEIVQYRFGEPLNTHSVVLDGKAIEKRELDYFQFKAADSNFQLQYKMDKEDIVWGLGENQRGMNKRGGIYVSYCMDDPHHTPDKKSLYGAHNFFVVDGTESFGIYIDFPGRVTFDVGFSHKDVLSIELVGKDADLYIIKGVNLAQIVRNFLMLIGKSYVPPKWAFGYQQSRWSYPDRKTVEEIAESFESYDMPCDAIYLDIDYMESYKNFTIDKEKFPNFQQFVENMKERGLRLIPIIDAGVKIDEGYKVYDEGIEKGYFCTDQNGKPFVGAVWPGRVHFPDFLNPEARKWFGEKYRELTDYGIEGFWNDMNEPAIFYTKRGLDHAIQQAKDSENTNLDIHSFFSLQEAFIGLSNHLKDYQSFYHDIEGKKVNHNQVHNLYGYYMTKAAAEGLEEINPNKRFLLFSRASSIGMHRYGGIWTGDNHSWWEHILLNLKMLPSLNMCGFLYIGADTGGFSGDTNAQMLIRWMQLSLFTPLFRNHSAMGTRQQEPFAFDEESVDIMRGLLQLRYKCIPYIYSEYMKAALKGDMYFAPLAFAYSDKISRRIEDQLLVGESLMIAPIYEENAVGRTVWLPEEMLLWYFESDEGEKYRILPQGFHYIEGNLDRPYIFIRKNKLFLMGNSGKNVEELNAEILHIIGFIPEQGSYFYYDDDGMSKDYLKGIHDELNIIIENKKDGYSIQVEKNGNPEVKEIQFEIVNGWGTLEKKTVQIF
ncbi:MAG: TIM-barrel domain-containing protein [Thermotaleaceae bacterium]